MPYATGAALAHPVDLRVPAHIAYLPVIRAVPETVAVLSEFDIDRVSDLGLAVDQVSTELIVAAVADALLELLVEPDADGLVATITVDTRADRAPDRSGFGWRVLTTLTDGLGVDHTPTADGAWRTSVRLRMARSGG